MKRSWWLLGAALIAAACSSDATKSTGTSTTLAGDATTTTTADDDATTIASDSTATTTTPTTTPTGADPTTTVAGVLTEARNIPTAWTAGAQEGDPEVFAALGSCEPFYEALAGGPYTQSRCGVWDASGGQRMWTVTRGVSGILIAIIWQPASPSSWVAVMRAQETDPGQWDDIAIVTGNTDSGPSDELVSGTRIAGASGKLAVVVIDVRSGTPRVVAVHPTGNHGVAVLRPGVGIEVWSAVEAEDIPKCCPTEFVQSFLRLVDTAWFVDTRGTVPADDPAIPVSEF